MIDTNEVLFESLSDTSRLWIFQSDRKLTSSEVEGIQADLNLFMPQWTSHNRSLKAEAKVLYDHFVVVALDEQVSNSASGCSIDSMTHQIQAICQANKNLNLLDRTTFYFLMKDGIKGIPMQEVSQAVQDGVVNSDSIVFNNLIKTKAELSTAWKVPIKDSWQKRFL